MPNYPDLSSESEESGVIIMTVAEFNAGQYGKYHQSVEKFEFGKGGFPHPGQYMFYDSRGEKRTKGYVATNGRKHTFGKTKKEALERFME